MQKALKISFKILLGIVALVILLISLVYVPFVQDWVKELALSKVEEATGMKIEVDYLRLSFPLDVEIENALVTDAVGDTMVVAEKALVSLAFAPLLGGNIYIDNAELGNCHYKMGNRDSALYLNTSISRFETNAVNIDLSGSVVDIYNAKLNGAKVDLSLKSDTTETESSSGNTMWTINARRIELAEINYFMSMPSVADSIGTTINRALLQDGVVDMRLSPMKITVEAFDLTADKAFYVPNVNLPISNGLDVNHLFLSDISIDVDSFYNSGAEIRVPLSHFRAIERSGLTLDAMGLFAMDSVTMEIKDFDVTTLFSNIKIDGVMGLVGNNAPAKLRLEANIGVPDVEMILPDMRPMLGEIPRHNDIRVSTDVSGTMSRLDLKDFSVSLPKHFSIGTSGYINDVFEENRVMDIDISGEIFNVDFVKPSILEARLLEQVNVPPLTLDGNVKMSGEVIAGDIQALTGEGELALNAHWNGRGEEYDLTMNVDSFPINTFLPYMGLDIISADVEVNGKGFDPKSEKTRLNADVILHQLLYKGNSYTNARVWANVANSHAEAGLVSLNADADFDIETHAIFKEDDDIQWMMSGDIRNVDLLSLGIATSKMQGSMTLNGNGVVNLLKENYDANVSINQLEWDMGDVYINQSAVDASFLATDSLLQMKIKNNDLNADFISSSSLSEFMDKITKSVSIIDSQVVARKLDIAGIQKELPTFDFKLTSGRENLFNNILASSKIGADKMKLSVRNDSLFKMQGSVLRLDMGETRLDTVLFNVAQQSGGLIYDAMIGNRRGTMDGFAHVDVDGRIDNDRISAQVMQRNIDGRVGFDLGGVAAVTDTTVILKFQPVTPILGYKNWTINEDNFVSYNFNTHHFDAKMMMYSDESHLNIYTEHVASKSQEDVVVNIKNIKLSEILSVSPFSPPIKGVLSADMRFNWDDVSLGGDGNVSIEEMYYGKERVGSFDLGVNLFTDKAKKIKADVSLLVDGVKTITATGALNDTTASNPFNLDFSMVRFPLRVINPFLPKNTAKFSGMLNGEMDITGDIAAPRFNGYIDFDTTKVSVNMLGATFYFSEDRIPVKDNVVTFTDYEIKGANENPMTINGAVDMGDLISPLIDLSMSARNMQFVNSSRAKGADVYGKGFVNLNADIKGDLSELDIDASVTLLGGSNITYLMTDATSAITSQSTGDMVKFVQFNDTLTRVKPDTIAQSTMTLNLDALINVSTGTTINVDMGSTGKVQLQGSGTLNYTMNSMDDSRFTGRYTIDKGYVKYSPPIISEKLFNFKEGSYVAFNGDMLNPILNIHAVDDIKANVTREGQNSRLVNFQVTVSVTNTLNNMNVVFDMSTIDDITIQNELQAMSAEQRANQAMNLLLYNVYTGPGTDASANISGNPLYSFLESQINTWAANNIKFVDVSFGIEQYDKTYDGSTSTTTNYSYKVSKSLFNDRFKIVIGGNYSTDVDADEDVAQNLINDVSFEYMLNRSGSMYVKIFRHVGYESILEGEVTQTGVGFVYKRKIQTLRDLFRFGRRKRVEKEPKQENSEVNQKADVQGNK